MCVDAYPYISLGQYRFLKKSSPEMKSKKNKIHCVAKGGFKKKSIKSKTNIIVGGIYGPCRHCVVYHPTWQIENNWDVLLVYIPPTQFKGRPLCNKAITSVGECLEIGEERRR